MNKRDLARIKPWDLVRVKKGYGRGFGLPDGSILSVVEYPTCGHPELIKVKDENDSYVFGVLALTRESG